MPCPASACAGRCRRRPSCCAVRARSRQGSMANPTSKTWRWTRRLAEAMPAGLLLAAQLGHAAEPPPLVIARADPSQNGLRYVAPAMTIYLEVSLNQQPYGAPQSFELRDGRLYASVATLRAIGFTLEGRDDGETRAPATLPGVAVRYDASIQRVAIDAPLALLSLATARLNAPGTDIPAATASPGLLLNYDLYSSRDDHGDNTTAFAELRAFGLGNGVLSQTAVVRSYKNEDDTRRTDSVRLDRSWRWSKPESMFSVT